MGLIAEILEIYSHYDFDTQVLVASVRHPIHVSQAAQMGAHVATMPFKVLQQMFKHPMTDNGIKGFLADWEKAKSAVAK
jgi:transaldolase